MLGRLYVSQKRLNEARVEFDILATRQANPVPALTMSGLILHTQGNLELARHPQTLLAYEMNGAPLSIEHGAPLRLRVETQLGFKMVKYLRSVEFVADFRGLGDGRGGWREDVQHYSDEAGI